MHLILNNGLIFPASLDRLARAHATTVLIVVWGIAMLSYHQDARSRLASWARVSQFLAIVCLIGLVVFGFTHRAWLNFAIAIPLTWLHIELSKRWRARPGAWW